MKKIIIKPLVSWFIFPAIGILINACVNKHIDPTPCWMIVSDYSKIQCNPKDTECENLKNQAKEQATEISKNKMEKPEWWCNKECGNLCNKILCKKGINESCKQIK